MQEQAATAGLRSRERMQNCLRGETGQGARSRKSDQTSRCPAILPAKVCKPDAALAHDDRGPVFGLPGARQAACATPVSPTAMPLPRSSNAANGSPHLQPSAVGTVRSRSPLRGSPGFTPGSRLSPRQQDAGLDAVDEHKICRLDRSVNRRGGHRNVPPEVSMRQPVIQWLPGESSVAIAPTMSRCVLQPRVQRRERRSVPSERVVDVILRDAQVFVQCDVAVGDVHSAWRQ